MIWSIFGSVLGGCLGLTVKFIVMGGLIGLKLFLGRSGARLLACWPLVKVGGWIWGGLQCFTALFDSCRLYIKYCCYYYYFVVVIIIRSYLLVCYYLCFICYCLDRKFLLISWRCCFEFVLLFSKNSSGIWAIGLDFLRFLISCRSFRSWWLRK